MFKDLYEVLLLHRYNRKGDSLLVSDGGSNVIWVCITFSGGG